MRVEQYQKAYRRKPIDLPGKPKTSFESLELLGHDEDFNPDDDEDAVKRLEPTDFKPGSSEKVELLRKRNEEGLPLHHPLDSPHCEKVAVQIPIYTGAAGAAIRVYSASDIAKGFR